MFCPLIDKSCPSMIKMDIMTKAGKENVNKEDFPKQDECIFYSVDYEKCKLYGILMSLLMMFRREE